MPYPHAAQDHQTGNARWMQEGGAAIVIRDEDLTPQRLREEIDTLLADRERLAAMSSASRKLARPEAAAVIADEVQAAAR